MFWNKQQGVLRPEFQRILLRAARDSIEGGLLTGMPIEVRLSDYPPELRSNRAAFVTLEIEGELRGCVGTIKAHRPLIEDVIHNAFASAFMDSRFPKLAQQECGRLEISISLLSDLEALLFDSESDAAAKLRPGIDGLMIEQAAFRGTYLPSMWETVPDPGEFLKGVKVKAGLPRDYWSASLKLWRFTAETFS